ncbi:MAG: hypothetical protein ACK2UK_13665 [Candidatus Promineifilaceae bacterium]
MLAVISDLHFEEETSFYLSGDGSAPPLTYQHNLPATPYRLLVQQLAAEADRNKAQKLEFVLAGDIFDLHRSGLWFSANPDGIRPYGTIDQALEDETLRILAAITEHARVAEVLAIFQLLAAGRYVNENGDERSFPVPVELHYLPGNHDRLANASPAIRTAVRGALGLSSHGARFANALSFDEERALVRHGQEYDFANFSVDLRHETSYPTQFPPGYYDNPAFGDFATIDIASQLPSLFRDIHGEETILADATLRMLYLRLLEFDDLRPLTAIFNYFIYADGQAVDKDVAWAAIEPVIIALLDKIHDDPFLLGWLETFDQPWLDLIDAVQAVLAAKPWRWTSKRLPLELAESVASVALRSTAKRPSTENYVRRESGIQNGYFRYVIAGHTHTPRISLISNDKLGERYYVDTGTWRNRVLATYDFEQFGRLKALNYMIAYGPNEDRGALPPERLKIASFDYWSGLTQGWERDSQGFKPLDKQR